VHKSAWHSNKKTGNKRNKNVWRKEVLLDAIFKVGFYKIRHDVCECVMTITIIKPQKGTFLKFTNRKGNMVYLELIKSNKMRERSENGATVTFKTDQDESSQRATDLMHQ